MSSSELRNALRGALEKAVRSRQGDEALAERSARAVRVSLFDGPGSAWTGDVLVLLRPRLAGAQDPREFAGRAPGLPEPPAGEFELLPRTAAVKAQQLLVIGVERAGRLGYPYVLETARTVLSALRLAVEDTQRVAIALPGPELGLDPIGCLEQFVRGLAQSLVDGAHPPLLQEVVLFEPEQAQRDVLRAKLDQLFRGTEPRAWIAAPNSWALVYFPRPRDAPADASLHAPFESALTSDDTPRAFVAMPFAPQMKDVFHFGIQQPARESGFYAERLDFTSFTGDVVEKIRERIERAHLVIADMTTMNPNVFLEIGYAWGKGRPTVLLWDVRSDAKKAKKQLQQVPFDVAGHHRIEYDSIHTLAERVKTVLRDLHPKLRARIHDATEANRLG